MMKPKNKRNETLLIIMLMYVIAISAAGAVFLIMPIENALIKMFVADIIATLIIWGFGLLVKNASVYDPYWSFMPPIIIIGWMLVLRSTVQLSVVLLGFAIAFWSLRLTLNWALGWVDFSVQDWRYTMIRNKRPHLWFLANLMGINVMPTVIVFFQMASIYYFLQAKPEMNLIIGIGFVMCILAVLIQYIADHQMTSFRLRNQGRHRCIDEGLWKYSRHPNYFGEVLMWWGVWVMYFGAFQSFNVLLIAPISMTVLFLFISIPMMEKKILASRPEYKNYQKSVSCLIPFFRLKQHLADDIVENEE
ncbi:MAG: DUF1295 domain-containing protein [Candidatus Izemoplasmatales bacterium]|nr:DUF1295 domain-containing protein [Candidatus Izemoplasmatales bacterium]